MSNKTIKHIWPVSLMMSLAIIGVIAAFVVLAAVPRGASADGGAPHSCAGMTAAEIAIHNAVDTQLNGGRGQCLAPGTTPTPGTTTPGTMPTPGTGQDVFDITSSSTSASSTVELKVEIANLSTGLPVGSSIELYLEDDYQVPALITSGAAYFVVTPASLPTGSGAPVLAISPVIVQTDDHFAGDDDYAIQVVIPDLCTSSNQAGQGLCDGQNGPQAEQTLTLVLTRAAGIKNPTEAKNYKVGAQILPLITDIQPNSGRNADSAATLSVLAKVALSDDDNKRGYELTVTGAGFNDGTTADAYVLNRVPTVEEWWSNLNCRDMVAAVGMMYDGDPDSAAGMPKTPATDSPNAAAYCKPTFGGLSSAGQTKVQAVFDKDNHENALKLCEVVVAKGTNVGSALTGSDDVGTVVTEVTVPTFARGAVNYICMVDGENRHSSDVERFHLEASIRVVPSTASSGDIVNLFAQDYPFNGQSLTSLKLAGQEVIGAVEQLKTQGLANGSATISFEIPGSVNDEPLQGTVRVDAQWGTKDGSPLACDADMPNPCTSKNTKITITGSELTASMTDVLPNETITITGNGFGSRTCINIAAITLDKVALEVDSESTITRDICDTDEEGPLGNKGVEVSNSGQFVATITLWPHKLDATNPTLISGPHMLSVEDSDGFVGETTLTIAEPTISVVPEVAGPRDYIVITGMNWPVDNVDNSNAGLVNVEIDDDENSRKYSVYTDNIGRFSIEHRVSKDVAIPSTNRVTGTYADVVKVGSFSVPAANVTVTPSEAQPGDMIDLSATDMKPYATADYVKIGGTVFDDPGANTDIDGNIAIDDVLVPGLDPGIYSVIINVDGTIAIGSIEVLAEDTAAGAAAELPGALEELGDSLVRVFHFNDVNKSWDFFDPRPDFADLNTLTKMVNGEPYWVLVSEGQEDVVLSNRARTLTCVGGDCWNQLVW